MQTIIVNNPSPRSAQDCPALEQDEHRRCVEFDKQQLELLTLIAGLEDSLAPQQGVGGAARPGTGHLMFEKLKLPEFDGARRNYLAFKLEWEETAGCSGYSPEIEVRELRKKLPKEVHADVKVMRTTAQIWAFLEQ